MNEIHLSTDENIILSGIAKRDALISRIKRDYSPRKLGDTLGFSERALETRFKPALDSLIKLGIIELDGDGSLFFTDLGLGLVN